MRVFVTGATGFVGTVVVEDLIAAGHKVLGLARSDEGATSLAAKGVDVQRGSLEDLESLAKGARETDGVIHTAFIHDFTKYAQNSQIDRRAIETLGTALAGSNRPLIVTSGLANLAHGRPATEEDAAPEPSAMLPRASEHAGFAQIEKGVRVIAMRLPPSTHGKGDHGFVNMLAGIAREKGASAYIDEGFNRWPATHRRDAASAYRLALESGTSGARYHPLAEEGIPFKDIATAIGRRLNLPVVSKSRDEAADHFGWFALFAGADASASGAWTRKQLGWQPKEPGLIADIEANYFGA